ncbi:MAG: dATP pyrophosphohydrolase [Geminicoccaceae bacterium]|nr:dATP pyrophosphohydrolase [Geminicoccaceae bacterium]
MRPEDLPLAIVQVRSKNEFRAFFGMTRVVYADDPHFVQPLTFERLEHVDPKKNPALAGMEVGYWIVYRGPTVVGRISAQINRAHLARYDDATAQFGFFEATDDAEVVRLLFDTVEIWARQRGMRRIQGPFSLSINDESGLLVEGFDTPPSMMMPHGRPYYVHRLEALNYRKAVDLIAYDFDVRAAWPAKAERLITRVGRMAEIRVRPLDMSRYADEIATIVDIFNDAWSANWNFIPFGDEEAAHLARSIKPLVEAECFAIGELDGRPSAMVVTLPNLNEAIADLDGRLLPLGWAKLLWRLKVAGTRSWRMPLMGVRRELQGTLKGAALTLGVIDAVKTFHASRGVERGELSWILENNAAIRDVIETVGGVPYKTYRVFEKEIVA